VFTAIKIYYTNDKIRMIRKDAIKTICIRLSNFRGIEIKSNLCEKGCESLVNLRKTRTIFRCGPVLGLIHFVLIRQKGTAHPHKIPIPKIDKWISIKCI